ncbi:finTRIM family, member 67 [Silurus meridionalis]|uniref:Zinc finger RING-type eukaryotic domain-containing protein n=1 Tax=Silurus meridionalis TaxID=175797 RepID=A0A8T0ANQ7_SILME|nr:hypothetical protein HF521_010014 [Silurus meridionalis]KAI5092683.1 finTRIM family, member 67 [Silurus meridionalis]
MAHAGFVEQNQYNCTICQEELKDPVTLPCGHNFCKARITAIGTRALFAKMKAMAFNIYSILQKSIESQSQAPNAASAPQAAPAPKPSVVVKDEDEDDEDDGEGEEA